MKLLGNWIVRNLLLALLIIAVLLTAAMIGLNVGTRHNKEIVVPDLRGMTVWQAREAASAAGMRVEIVDSVYSRRHRGTVRSHNPAAGEMVKDGRRILLTVNAVTSKKVTVPNLVGYSVRQAAAELKTRGLVLGRLSYRPDMATNNVLSQLHGGRPVAAGSLVPAESVIDLVIGLNASDNETRIPDVTGETLQGASDILHEYYLNVRSVHFAPGLKTYEDSLSAVVYKQAPSATEYPVGLGTDVTLYLKAAAKPASEK